jgi:hypothetical protein
MNSVYVVYHSTNEILEHIETYFNEQCKKESILLNQNVDVIPAKYASQIEFVTTSSKYHECKDFVRKTIDTTIYKEVLFDGSLNNIFVMYQNDIDAYWCIPAPVNKLITSYFPNKNDNIFKKAKYTIFLKVDTTKILIGITDSYYQAQKLIELSCGEKVNFPAPKDEKLEHVAHSCGLIEYVIKNI